MKMKRRIYFTFRRPESAFNTGRLSFLRISSKEEPESSQGVDRGGGKYRPGTSLADHRWPGKRKRRRLKGKEPGCISSCSSLKDPELINVDLSQTPLMSDQ